MPEEIWSSIPEFPDYKISNLGRVLNLRTERIMRTSVNNYGHVKIGLMAEWPRERHYRSVATLVAEAFVEPPTIESKSLVMLDGDTTNIVASNLAWRPAWFAWRYVRQLKEHQPRPYHNLRILDVTNDVEYDSMVHAGITNGLLFIDIWRSTYRGDRVFPINAVFRVIGEA